MFNFNQNRECFLSNFPQCDARRKGNKDWDACLEVRGSKLRRCLHGFIVL